MGKKLYEGAATGAEPFYRDGEICQEFTFRTAVVIPKSSLQQIVQSIGATFKTMLEKNKITDHAWPPTRVELTPHGDFMGFQLLLGTKALMSGQTVLHALPGANPQVQH